jgi:transposase-like protein
MPVTRVRYSEAFKRQVVRRLEHGSSGSLNAVCRAYGIGATTTVARWAREYGREDLLPKNVRIETLNERDEMKEARKRIRDLERALADAHMDYCLEQGFLKRACELLGKDMDDFKKKNGITLSDTRKGRQKR